MKGGSWGVKIRRSDGSSDFKPGSGGLSERKVPFLLIMHFLRVFFCLEDGIFSEDK